MSPAHPIQHHQFLIVLVLLESLLLGACGMNEPSRTEIANADTQLSLASNLSEAEQGLNDLGITFNLSGSGFLLDPKSSLLQNPQHITQAVFYLNLYAEAAERIIEQNQNDPEVPELIKKRSAALALAYALNGGRSPRRGLNANLNFLISNEDAVRILRSNWIYTLA